MIKSWMFEQLNISCDADPAHFDAVACSKEYAWRSELWAQLETLGFHGIFFSEHHFSGLRASPSPGVLAAWVAARSQNLRIGVLGWVLPLWQPWRFLEKVAVLDQLSQGRVEIGVARGSSVDEAAAVGIAEVDIVPMYREALDILEQAWLSPCLSYRGRYWSFEQLGMVPRPLQYPSPPIWATVRSTDAAAEAAKRGHRLCTGFCTRMRLCVCSMCIVRRQGTCILRNAWRFAVVSLLPRLKRKHAPMPGRPRRRCHQCWMMTLLLVRRRR